MLFALAESCLPISWLNGQDIFLNWKCKDKTSQYEIMLFYDLVSCCLTLVKEPCRCITDLENALTHASDGLWKKNFLQSFFPPKIRPLGNHTQGSFPLQICHGILGVNGWNIGVMWRIYIRNVLKDWDLLLLCYLLEVVKKRWREKVILPRIAFFEIFFFFTAHLMQVRACSPNR